MIGNNSEITGHAYKLHINYCHLNTRKHFFCNHAANVWSAVKAVQLILEHYRHLNGV